MTSLRLMSVAMTDVRTRAVLIVEPGYVYLSRLNLRGLLRSNVNGQNSLNIPKGKAKSGRRESASRRRTSHQMDSPGSGQQSPA